MPNTHPEDHDLAGRAWAQLLVLRANPYSQALPALTTLANEISITAAPAFSSDDKIRNARSGAWLAVCALAQQIEKDPKADGIEQLWLNANDAVKIWERQAE